MKMEPWCFPNWRDEMTEQTIVRVEYYWDAQPGVDAGWYARTVTACGSHADDSQKIWFPVYVDEFTADDESGLRSALAAAFPGATCCAVG